MFSDLDDTLINILDDDEDLPKLDDGDVLKDAEISFETPKSGYEPEKPTVNLYFFEVYENRDLRDPEPIFELKGQEYMRRRPPVRVDCVYMVTTWSGTSVSGEDKVRNEHHLLALALQWLTRFQVLPEKYLTVALKKSPFPPPMMTAQMNGGKSMGEFWSALEQPPRPSFNLLVTIAMELGVEEPEGPAVITKDMRLSVKGRLETKMRWLQIGGKVFETADPEKPVIEAQVRLKEKNLVTMTDVQGRFTFTAIKPGDYTLEVSKSGFSNKTKSIKAPAENLNDYDVGL